MQRDADGDGRGSTAPEDALTLCEGDTVPAGFTSGESDCDDHDPGAWQLRCVDEDGDGAVFALCMGEGASPCPVISEVTPDPGPYDCDDTDPEKVDYFYEDLDGDGTGAGEPVCWNTADGWSYWGGDCDDGDPAISPRALEYFGDGRDSDCDGSDQGPCAPGSLDDVAWAGNGSQISCGGSDLALGYVSCSSCFVAQATFAVENRGDSTFTGGITIASAGVALQVSLPPGERRVLVSGPFVGQYSLELIGQTDCNSVDNQVSVSNGHCI